MQGKERAAYVQGMFDRIAGRYNLMNRLMTFGQDLRWRRFVVQQARLKPGDKLLDLATGTGDIAFEALHQVPGVQAVGGDFSLGMMLVGQASAAWRSGRSGAARMRSICPFPTRLSTP